MEKDLIMGDGEIKDMQWRPWVAELISRKLRLSNRNGFSEMMQMKKWGSWLWVPCRGTRSIHQRLFFFALLLHICIAYQPLYSNSLSWHVLRPSRRICSRRQNSIDHDAEVFFEEVCVHSCGSFISTYLWLFESKQLEKIDSVPIRSSSHFSEHVSDHLRVSGSSAVYLGDGTPSSSSLVLVSPLMMVHTRSNLRTFDEREWSASLRPSSVIVFVDERWRSSAVRVKSSFQSRPILINTMMAMRRVLLRVVCFQQKKLFVHREEKLVPMQMWRVKYTIDKWQVQIRYWRNSFLRWTLKLHWFSRMSI